MKILVISNIEWSDTNAFGNTVSNFFEGLQDVELTSLYRRNSIPDNNVCKDYYCISTTDMILNFFQKEKIGHYFTFHQVSRKKSNCNKKMSLEKKIISIIHKLGISFLVQIEDFIFSFKKWDNARFHKFVSECKHDIIFTFIKASSTSLLIQERIKQICPDCRIVGFIADDVYAVASNKGKKSIEKQLNSTDLLYGITKEICFEYSKKFGKDIKLLHKGCTFDEIKIKKNKNLKLVYAGNLLYGRGNTLANLAKEIKKINDNNERKIELHIYTSTEVKKSLKEKLDIMGTSYFHTAIPYDEVKNKCANADIVLHVESFQPKEYEQIRYSFSTKITDCMQSGSVLMVIGPKGISSVEYAREIPGAIVIDNSENIENTLRDAVSYDLTENSEAMHKFAEENFAINKIQESLYNDFCKLIN